MSLTDEIKALGPQARTAHFTIEIDRKSLRVVSCGIYSEAHPTSRHHTIEIHSETAPTYEGACRKMAKSLASGPWYDWLEPVWHGRGPWPGAKR